MCLTAKELVKSFESLNICLEGNSPIDYSNAKTNVKTILSYFEVELSRQELDAAFIEVFNETTGIISFFKKAVRLENFKDAVAEVFELFKYLLFYFHKHVSPHVLDIKAACLSCVYNFNASAVAKERACDALITLIQKGPWGQDLGITELIDKLLQELWYQKLLPKITQKICHLLGVISHHYPECMASQAENLLKLYCSELDKQAQMKNKISYPVITGCLDGLAEYMHTFPPSSTENPEVLKKIYGYVKLWSNPDAEKRVAQRAALRLIHQHGSQLAKLLYENYTWWHARLTLWQTKNNADDRNCGKEAVNTFYEQMAHLVQDNAFENAKVVLMYFISFFKEKMLDKNVTVHEMSDIIKGFGIFAGPCLAHMTNEDVLCLSTLLLQCAHQAFVSCSSKAGEPKIGQNLSNYIESIASIIFHLRYVAPDHLAPLKHMTVFIFQNFAGVPKKFHSTPINALTDLFYSLSVCAGVTFDDFIKIIVFQGLVRSCSHPPVIDVELQRDQTLKHLTSYKDYLPLWVSILSIQNYGRKYMNLVTKRSVVCKLYDQLVQTVLDLLTKLDLRTKKKMDKASTEVYDPNGGLEAVVPQDFQVFINLVDLCVDILSETDHHMFEKWIQSFTYNIMVESYSKPFISGFYKLLAISLQLSDELNYYDLGSESNSSPKVKKSCELVCQFLEDVLIRTKHYKGDLQIACLEMFLATPLCIVPRLLHAAPEAFQAIFRVGRNYLQIARKGLNALKKWFRVLPSDDMQLLLKDVLPLMDPFLQSKGFEIGVDVELELLEADSTKGLKRHSRRNCLTRKRLVEQPDTELVQLQREILMFLGPLRSDSTLSLLKGCPQSEMKSWGHTKKLKLTVPFRDMRPCIYLDQLLPRVLELTLSSSDRKTRVAACELLHAILMFMLGTSMQIAGSDPSELSELFENLFLPLLQLGCDADQVVYQLFHPLMLQLMHWFSSKFQLRSKNTAVLMETLLDGIAHATDAALRDISAECLHEFVVWAIKQHPIQELDNSPVNVKFLLKRIQMFCLHPSSSKRLGAALAFNSVYTVLREEEAVVNEFWLELLYCFIQNLSQVEHKDTLTSTLAEVLQAVNHLERVLKAKADIFNKPSKQRRKPPEIEGILLHDALVWLLKHCAHIQAECRHKCMELVCSLAPLLPDCTSAKGFLNGLVSREGLGTVLKICEGSKEKPGIAQIPTLSKNELEQCTLDEIINWLQQLLACLDCYVWLFGESLIDVDFLLMEDTRIMEETMYYLQCVGKETMDDSDDLVGSWSCLPPQKSSHYKQVKCTVAVRLFDFVVVISQQMNGRNILQYVPDTFFGSYLWHLIATCLFCPASLGFDLCDNEVLQGLPSRMQKLLQALKVELSPVNLLHDFNTVLKKCVEKYKYEMLGKLKENLQNSTVPQEHHAILKGLQVLQKTGICAELEQDLTAVSNNILRDVFLALVEQPLGVIVTLQPTAQRFGSAALEYAFSLQEQVTSLLQYVQDSTKITNLETQSVVQHGDYFLETFKKSVCTHILQWPENTVNILLSNLTPNSDSRSLCVLEHLLQFVDENKKERTDLGIQIASSIIQHWQILQVWGEQNISHSSQLLTLLVQVAALMKQPIGCFIAHININQWILEQLSSPNLSLHYKSQAIDLLPCLTNHQQINNPDLRNVLQELKEKHFPQLSAELHHGYPQRDSFVLAFSKLLFALEQSGSPLLLHSVMGMTLHDKHHICENDIQKTLQAFTHRLNSEEQLQAVNVAYSIFLESKLYDPEIRLGCVQRFVIPLLKACCSTAVEQFYVCHVRNMFIALELKLEGTRILQIEHCIVTRIGTWLLFELLFFCVPSEQLENKTFSIVQAAFPSQVETGRELIQDLTRKAFTSRTETVPLKGRNAPSVLDFFRQMQCAAYNTLSAIVSNTKKEERFYTGFLFSENIEKKQMVWENLIDCNKSYEFPIDWDEIPSRRKHLVSIRKDVGTHKCPVRYIPTDTQLLFTSTLTEDVTRFDLSMSVIRQPVGDPETSTSPNNVEVELEADSFNEHECMPTLCGVVQHLVDYGISPAPQEGEQVTGLPPWMECLCKCLQDKTKHRNIHIFILKLILNKENVFQPYSKFLVYPIIRNIVDGSLGYEINYMVADIIMMLLSWGSEAVDTATETEKLMKSVISELLNFLMANSYHKRRDILKHNLEIIRTVTEVWKSCLDIPHQLLLDYVTAKSNEDYTKIELGIQLTGIVLANSLRPWNSMGKQYFLEGLLSHLNHCERLIYRPCSEVVGMTLKSLDQQLTGKLADEDDFFLNKLNKILYGMKSKYVDNFLICLNGINKHYTPVVNAYLDIVLFQLPKVSYGLKTLCLELILSGVHMLGHSAYAELVGKGLLTFLTNHDGGTQLLALQLIDKILPDLEPEPLQELIHVVIPLAASKNALCRGVVYNILMWAYDEQCLGDEGRGALLAGLVDIDLCLQDRLFKFWSEEARLPTPTPERLEILLNNTYSSHTERHFLGYASRLLLDTLVTMPDYNVKLFDHPLSQCKFQELQVLVSWRARHASFAPMFAETLSSQLHHVDTLDIASQPKLRATQSSLAFQPTADIFTFDPDPNNSKILPTFSASLNSSLLFTVGTPKNFRMGPNFGTTKMKPIVKSGLTAENTATGIRIPKRYRFLRDQKKVQSIHASHEVRRAARRQELQQERVHKREANVCMYRNYRIGDFPDIEIPYSAVMKPLQALTQHDALIGRQVFVSLFSGIMAELSGEMAVSYAASITAALGNILNKTVQGSPMLMGAILEIALAHGCYISFDPDNIAVASKASGLLQLGSLVLEQQLLTLSDAEPSAKRTHGQNDESNCWLRLAELYQGMDEWDVVHGIFSQKLECHRTAKAAIESEAECSWDDAEAFYRNAIRSNDSDNQKDYYYEAFYKCLASLSEWEKLQTCIEDQLENNLDSLWLDPWNQAKLLPWLFISQLQLIGLQDCNKFLDALQKWLKDKEKTAYITTHLNEELAVFCMLEGDFERAQFHIEHIHRLFLENWAHMNPGAFKQRATALNDLHRLSELQMFLNFHGILTSDGSSDHDEHLHNQWSNNLPEKMDCLMDWDRRTAYRTQFILQLKEKYGQNAPWLEQTEYAMNLAMIDAALAQKNFHVARKYLEIKKQKLADSSNPNLRLQWTIGYSKCHWLRSRKIHEDRERLDAILQAWDKLISSHPQLRSSECIVCPLLQHKACVQISQYVLDVWTLLQNNGCVLSTVNENSKQKLMKWINAANSSTPVMQKALRDYGLNVLESSVHVAENNLARQSQAKTEALIVAEGYLKMAQFCQTIPDDDDPHIILSVLRAMKHGSELARQLFPCLLQLQNLSTKWSEVFKTECMQVPVWMFLSWVNQILACLNTPVGPALYDVTLRLAREYPQAVTYPFQLSREKYKLHSSDPDSQRIRDHVKRLEDLLMRDSLTQTFLKALSCLAEPEMILHYHIEKLASAAKEHNFNKDHIKAVFDSLVAEVFPPSTEQIQGASFKALKEYRRSLEKAVENLYKGKTEALQNIAAQLVSVKGKRKLPCLLKEYSIWLHEFQMSRWSDRLEIPGQYTGEMQPLPQYHVRIAGFHHQVRVMPSLRHPILVTIIGNDAKEYRYLVKFGEDLRQDQRIEQMFHLMNKVLTQDPCCSHRNLELITYRVVPLTCRLGIIQWIDGTDTLKHLLHNALKNDEERKNWSSSSVLYQKWLQAASPLAQAPRDIYGIAYLHYSRSQAVAAYNERVNMIPWDIMKRLLLQLTPSPERFFSLRQSFACSYAVLCVSHWLLGIGDRHLDNCLLIKANGQCVGIDFGHAFGTATQFLAVPELVPFRLTPHILNVMQPMRETGLFQGTMVHCLRALRNSKDILLATMEVFVQEPSLDWLELANKQQNANDNQGDKLWYPRQKLQLAKQKMEGANPVAVMSEEIQAGHSGFPQYLTKYLEVLHGYEQHNVRSRLPACNLTSHEQVECLIDMATDPNILGRTWIGWCPWM